MKKLLFFSFLIVLLFFLFVLKESFVISKVCFEDKCFEVEIADTSEARKQGLMFREEFGQDKAMLFVFEKEGVYGFHMRNVNFPLDIVWLDNDKNIVFVKQNALPEQENIIPDKKAKYVLEFNAGVVESLDADIGDKFIFKP